jgi:hypothetical protein
MCAAVECKKKHPGKEERMNRKKAGSFNKEFQPALKNNTLIRRNQMPHFATGSSIFPQFHVFSVFSLSPNLLK